MLATAYPPLSRTRSNPEDNRSLHRSIIAAAAPDDLTELDARSPSPPKLVPAILAALNAIPPGHPQFVRTADAPVELVRQLEAHGIEACPVRLADGTWRTLLILKH